MIFKIGEKECKNIRGFNPKFFIPVGVSYDSEKQEIILWKSSGKEFLGASFKPLKVINKRIEYLTLTESEWFIPYIERMANGEDVPLEEIKQAYRDNNDGREIEEVTS